MKPQGRNRASRLLWRINVWLDIHPLAAYCFIVLGLAFALWRVEQNFNATEHERDARAQVATGIIYSGCTSDNQQDKLLAQLVTVSLSPPKFGEGIPPAKLTDFDQQVLAAIDRVQTLTAQLTSQDEGQADQQHVFEIKLAELNDLRPCAKITKAYQEAEPPKHPRHPRKDRVKAP